MRQDPGHAELSPDTRPRRTDHRRAGLRGCPADHAGPRYPGPGYAGLRRRADRRYAGTGAGSLVIGRRGGSTGPSCTPAGRSAPAMDARLPGRRRPAGHRASLRAPGGRAGRIDTHPTGGAMATGEGGSPIPVAAWCADSGPRQPRPGPRPAVTACDGLTRGRGLADHTTDVRWVGLSIAAHRNRFPVPSKACAPQDAGPAKPADQLILLPDPAGHNPATRVIASQSSARHQGAEQRKRGQQERTATDVGQALPGWMTRSRPSTRQHRPAKAEPEEKVRPPGRCSPVRAPGTHAEHAAIRRCVAGLRQQPMIVCRRRDRSTRRTLHAW